MRFLTVAERELRAAARRQGTYVLRWTTAAGFFVVLIWLMWAMGALQYQNRVHDVFVAFSVMAFFYCLLVGAIRTADCISSERRDGTLGLLFLTNLNSLEIIGGKLCSNALPTVYGLLAIFPMLALPLLMGGVTPAEFGRTMLALLDAILFSLGCGFLATVLGKRQFPAVTLAMGLAVVFGAGTLGTAAIIAEYTESVSLVHGLSTLCPLYTLLAAGGGKIFQSNHYWLSLGNVAILSLSWFGLATMRLGRSWRDRAKSAPRQAMPSAFQQSVSKHWRKGRTALRQRLLNLNPFYWLAARQQISSPIFILIVVALVFITVFGTAPLFIKMFSSQNDNYVLGSLFAWLWTGLAIHVLTLYYAAMISSQALAEDRQTGALELIFATPVREQTISRGLWMAFRRRMLFPAIAVFLTHGCFLWHVMTMELLDLPGATAPPGTTQWELLWAVLFNNPIGRKLVDWQFVLIVRVLVMILPLAVVWWFTLGWVGRWLGLRMKHPGFAPLVALALLAIPPTLIFSLICYAADKMNVFQSNSRHWVPVLVWGAFAMALGHCAILSGWAARHLRADFRHAVVGRFDVPRRTWRARGRSVLRFSLRATGLAVALAVVGVGYYGCQNVRSRRAWSEFQAELKERGQSLDVAATLPPPVPDEANFARAREFQDILSKRNKPLATMLDRLPDLDEWEIYQSASSGTYAWTSQRHASLTRLGGWIGLGDSSNANKGKFVPPPVLGDPYVPPPPSHDPTNNAELAPIVLKTLAPLDESLNALAVAARRPSFQITTNRSALGVLHAPQSELRAIARLHFLFALRSLTALESGQTADAGEDLLTCFRLVRLARQSPDIRSSSRAHVLMASSFQPLWEGLERRRWNAPQLAAFQTELVQFNLLADYTNAIGRIVRANIEIWKAIPDETNNVMGLPDPSGGYRNNHEWRGMPRAWWFDNCIQLYRVGETAIADVDVAGERLSHSLGWNELSGLPLDHESQQFFQTMMDSWQMNNPGHVAFAQTVLNQARIAVALERHRLATQRFPVSLNELVPVHFTRVPNDVEMGRPMIYQPNTNGSYLLRGLGQNHANDRTNGSSDDWLWAYPTNAAAAAKSP